MNAAEHYQEAERLLGLLGDHSPSEPASLAIANAAIGHAILTTAPPYVTAVAACHCDAPEDNTLR